MAFKRSNGFISKGFKFKGKSKECFFGNVILYKTFFGQISRLRFSLNSVEYDDKHFLHINCIFGVPTKVFISFSWTKLVFWKRRRLIL